MHTLKQFVVWVNVPIETVNHKKLLAYLDHLLDRGLQPKTITAIWTASGGFTTTSLKKSRWRWSTR
jgi:hypothetical protein